MERDIVCGMEVDPDKARMTTHGDRNFYFCSEKCHRAFVANPTKYIEKVGGAIGSTEGSPKKTATGESRPSRT